VAHFLGIGMTAPQGTAREPHPVPGGTGRIPARPGGRLGRRSVRELPRGSRPAVLRARLRGPGGARLRRDERARQPERLGTAGRHDAGPARRCPGLPPAGRHPDRRRLRHGVLLPQARRRAFPARDPEYAAVPRLRPRGHPVPVPARADHGELLRPARDRPAGRPGPFRRDPGRAAGSDRPHPRSLLRPGPRRGPGLQHEMLNWFCLLGAMFEAGMRLDWSTFVATDVFNSNKCFAIYREDR
jgi:hypothetical protein